MSSTLGSRRTSGSRVFLKLGLWPSNFCLYECSSVSAPCGFSCFLTMICKTWYAMKMTLPSSDQHPRTLKSPPRGVLGTMKQDCTCLDQLIFTSTDGSIAGQVDSRHIINTSRPSTQNRYLEDRAIDFLFEILNNEKLGKDSCWMPVVRRPLCAHPQTAWFPSKANLNFGNNIRISF